MKEKHSRAPLRVACLKGGSFFKGGDASEESSGRGAKREIDLKESEREGKALTASP